MNENAISSDNTSNNLVICNDLLMFVQNIYRSPLILIHYFPRFIEFHIELNSLSRFSIIKTLTLFYSTHRWRFSLKFPLFSNIEWLKTRMGDIVCFANLSDVWEIGSFAIVIIRMPTVAVNTSLQFRRYEQNLYSNTTASAYMCSTLYNECGQSSVYAVFW